MRYPWRLRLLTGLLAMLFVIQQLLVWRERRSSDLRTVRDKFHIDEVVMHGKAVEQELIHGGSLWIGDLHAREAAVASDFHRLPNDVAVPMTHRIAGSIVFEEESLTVNYEFHECDPKSSLCASSGSMTVLSGDRAVCSVSVGLIRSPGNAVNQDDYRVAWQSSDESLRLSEGDRLQLMRSLAGTSEVPDRDAFRRLLSAAYAQESPAKISVEPESIQKQLLRAVFAAIVHSRNSPPTGP